MKLKIMLLNICSLRNKLDELYALIKSGGFDVVIVNETWLKTEETKFYNIPNFQATFSCREGSRGGGTAIYVNRDLICNTIVNQEKFNKIIVEIEIQNVKMFLGTMYRPPQQTNLEDFFNELDLTLHNFKNMIFAGDMNLNLLKSNDQEITEYLNLMDAHGYRVLNDIHPKFPTREASGSILDHFLTDMSQDAKLRLKNISLSDHSLIAVDWIAHTNAKKPSSSMVYKEFRKMNCRLYEELVHEYISTSAFFPSLEGLTKFIQKAKEEATSIVKKLIKKESFEWMTLEILQLIDQKNEIYQNMKNYPGNQNVKISFKKTEQRLKNKIKLSKRVNFNSKIQSASSDT